MQSPSLYNHNTTTSVFHSHSFRPPNLATCQQRDTIVSYYNPTMATNGSAGQQAADGDWKPRDMQGEMRSLCAGLKSKVDKFLNTESSDELVKNVQSQVRTAKGIIDDALKQYKYALRPV